MNLQIIICSYKANREFTVCLYQLAMFGIKNKDLLIYENSPEDYTLNRDMLNKYGIKYINNPGGTHAETMNRALEEATADYVLLLDSDCFCLLNPKLINTEICMKRNLQLYGDICGDRGGFHIHKRVHPWWCFVDMSIIRKFNIQFVDFERIKASNSESFIKTELLASPRDPRGYYYDAGSTMYEDIIKHGGVCADVGDNKPYIHVEGSSWRNMFPAYKEIVEAQAKWVEDLKTKLNFNEANLKKISE